MAIVSSIIFRDENCELHKEASKQEATYTGNGQRVRKQGRAGGRGACVRRSMCVVLRWRLDCILDIESVCPLNH